MKTMKNTLVIAVAGLVLAVSPMANATLSLTTSVGGAAAGANKINFDSLPLGSAGGTVGGVGVSFLPDAKAVQGSVSGQYAAPFLSGLNANGFGNVPTSGPDTSTYLSTGVGEVILSFASSQNYLGLLWGSVDNYNTLKFYNGNTLVGSVVGTDVWANANGDQGVNGTYYVNINSDLGFNKVVASSSQYAFEFDNVAFSAVPEPSTIVAGGMVLLPFGLSVFRSIRRTRKA